jgi:hypothetical protein
MENTVHRPVAELGPREFRQLQNGPSDDGEANGRGGIHPSTDGDPSTDAIFSMVNTARRLVFSEG